MNCFDKFVMLGTALEFLAISLQSSEVANAAAASMCSICNIASVRLKDDFKSLLKILENLPSFSLSNESAVAVIKG